MPTDAERETLETMLNRNFLFSEADKKLVRMGWMLRVQQEENATLGEEVSEQEVTPAIEKAKRRWRMDSYCADCAIQGMPYVVPCKVHNIIPEASLEPTR